MSTSFLTRATPFASVLINAGGTAESPIFARSLMGSLETLSLRVASVSGTADVKVQLATSPDEVNFDAYADNVDIVASTLLAKPNNPEGYNPYPLPNPLNRYFKFKITGIAANPADTLADAYLFFREGDI